MNQGEQLRNDMGSEHCISSTSSSMNTSTNTEAEIHSTISPVVETSPAVDMTSERVKELTTQMDHCREAQFKSNFHQTAYGWRAMLENSEEQDSAPQAVADEKLKRNLADSEVTADTTSNKGSDCIYDFDLFFESYLVADDEKEKAVLETATSLEVNEDLNALASQFGWFDEELMKVLLSESETSKSF